MGRLIRSILTHSILLRPVGRQVAGGGATTFYILREDGAYVLREDGFKVVREES